MAHSNRERLKKKRGGLTRNQAMKAGRSAKQQERLREVTVWVRHLEEERANPQKKEVSSQRRVRSISMITSVQNRRRNVIVRLTQQLESMSKDDTTYLQHKQRINKELHTLKKRVM